MFQQVLQRHDNARRAEPALHAVLLPQGVLQFVQAGLGVDAFDRGHLAAVGLYREHRTTLDRAAVEKHRARTALARVAAHLRAGEAERVTDEVDEK